MENPHSKPNVQDPELEDFLSERTAHNLSLAMPSGDPYWQDLAFYANSYYATAFSGSEMHSIVTYFGTKKQLSIEEILDTLLAASRNYVCSRITLDRHTLNHRTHFRNGLLRVL